MDLATRGRKRGFCAVLATQRLSKLHKDAAAECNNKLIGRTGLDVDMKRAYKELGFTSQEQYLSLRDLEPGEFFAFGPAISRQVSKVMVGKVRTTHPKAGAGGSVQLAQPTNKIKALLKKLADLPQEAQREATTVAELRQNITALRRELSLAKRANPTAPAVKVERIEIPAIGKRSLEGLKKAETSMKRILAAIKDANMLGGEHLVIIERHFAKFSSEIAKASRDSFAIRPPALPPRGLENPIIKM